LICWRRKKPSAIKKKKEVGVGFADEKESIIRKEWGAVETVAATRQVSTSGKKDHT